jgi:hypothetical protein
MKILWTIIVRWLRQDVLSLFFGEESVMGKVIAFYVPTHFRPAATRWTPPGMRGKVLAFARRPQRATLAQTVSSSRKRVTR